jgi:hypothetical protein
VRRAEAYLVTNVAGEDGEAFTAFWEVVLMIRSVGRGIGIFDNCEGMLEDDRLNMTSWAWGMGRALGCSGEQSQKKKN